MMPLIAMQNDFLPTDTVAPGSMWLDNHWFGPVMFGCWIGCVILAIISVESHGFPGAGILALVFLVGGFTSTGIHVAETLQRTSATQEANEKNEQNLIKNVETVYDVEVVEDGKTSEVAPENSPTILVIQDEVGYEVILKQNSETYEPTLVMIASPDSEVKELRKK